jgi:hypothetical protein
MVNLSREQRAHLSAVRAARDTERNARTTLEARLRAALADEVETLRAATALAVRAAHEAGVPLRQIGREGLGTADFATVRRYLGQAEPTPSTPAPGPRLATDDERHAAGVLPGETALLGVLPGRLGVTADGGATWAAVLPTGEPGGALSADDTEKLRTRHAEITMKVHTSA